MDIIYRAIYKFYTRFRQGDKSMFTFFSKLSKYKLFLQNNKIDVYIILLRIEYIIIEYLLVFFLIKIRLGIFRDSISFISKRFK